MNTIVRYYGILTEFAAKEQEVIELEGQKTSEDIMHLLIDKYPEFGDVQIVFFQNQKLCTPEQLLLPGQELDCMPPFSGG